MALLYLISADLPLFIYPCYHSFRYSLSHQYSYFRWPKQGTLSPPTMLKRMDRTTTKMPTHCHPHCLLLSKCWLCKHICFRSCSKPSSTYIHNPMHHRHRVIDWEIFSALSHQSFLMLWTWWMLMFGSSLLRGRCKWCSATTVRRWC
jgi:hypothetical protein